jgi:uncharacterized protein (TIGR02145 family)
MCIKSKSLLLGLLFITLNCCDVSDPVLDPDYTGQIGQVTDIDGNIYKTVGIGSQIWMAQNLRTTKLNDGILISEVKSDSIWNYYPQIEYCWYNNDSIKGRIYGALYSYYVINSKTLCPVGWHVPEDFEWMVLANFLGGERKAGGKLKDYNTIYWNSPNNCFANSYGFSALPGGIRIRSHTMGGFDFIGDRGFWWTSTSKNEFRSSSILLYYDNTSIGRSENKYGDGLSVRCIKD